MVLKLLDKIIQHDTALSVIWQIGKRCNYECFYCNDDLHDKISPDVDIIILKKIYDRIKQQYSGNINFSITGGEPTLHPNLIEFCKYISHGNKIVITTNGFKNVKYLQELQKYANLTISYHPLYIKNDDIFIEKILQLSYTSIHIMLEHDYLDRAEYVYEKLKNFCGCHYRPVRKKFIIGTEQYLSNKYKTYYSDEQNEKVNDLIENSNEPGYFIDVGNNKTINLSYILHNKLFCFTDWQCSSGVKSLYIAHDNIIYNATCRMKKLGDFNNFKMLNKYITCIREGCTCISDLKLDKYYSLEI